LESVESDEEVPQIRAIPCLCIGDSVQLEHGMSTTCGRCMALEKSGQVGSPTPWLWFQAVSKGEKNTQIQHGTPKLSFSTGTPSSKSDFSTGSVFTLGIK